jgi:anti-sigma factor RsiW
MNAHPERQLSAYLDEALDLGEKAQLDAHLAGCAACRARLADLAAVSSLLADLPQLAPRRSLLLRRLPAWLVPARWASTIAAAGFAAVFLASSMSAALPRAMPAAAPGGGAPERGMLFATATPVEDASKDTTAAAQRERATPVPRGQPAPESVEAVRQAQGQEPLPAWLWLAGAIAAGGVALGLERIRRARA